MIAGALLADNAASLHHLCLRNGQRNTATA